MNRIDQSRFEKLLLEETPLIDVRAPVEFHAGSIPGSVNLPLITDSERHLVGLTYKNQGQASAIELGHQIVSGEIRQERIQSWISEIQKKPESIIYCFRGGLRSQTVQLWLKERGVDRPIIAGGYKALRQFLIDTLIEQSQRLSFEVVSGPTGSGKTTFLKECRRPMIDLEALARHRGSAFGAMESPQPSQIDFENSLALRLLQLSSCGEPILIESESRMIGHRYIPDVLFSKMKSSPLMVLNLPIDERVENIFKDYILNSSLGTRGEIAVFQKFQQSVRAISRKLGGLRAQEILKDLELAQIEFESGRGLDANRVWIRKLLQWYYDPMYEYGQRSREVMTSS